jgi:hypothetical protein
LLLWWGRNAGSREGAGMGRGRLRDDNAEVTARPCELLVFGFKRVF